MKKKPAKRPGRSNRATPSRPRSPRLVPGEVLPAPGDVVVNGGRRTQELVVANGGDRPIQVGSHFHFFEVNRALRFERAQAFGMRLDIPAGTAVRFEPGDEKRVRLVEIGGAREVWGLNGLTNGPVRPTTLAAALARSRSAGFERAES